MGRRLRDKAQSMYKFVPHFGLLNMPYQHVPKGATSASSQQEKNVHGDWEYVGLSNFGSCELCGNEPPSWRRDCYGGDVEVRCSDCYDGGDRAEAYHENQKAQGFVCLGPHCDEMGWKEPHEKLCAFCLLSDEERAILERCES